MAIRVPLVGYINICVCAGHNNDNNYQWYAAVVTVPSIDKFQEKQGRCPINIGPLDSTFHVFVVYYITVTQESNIVIKVAIALVCSFCGVCLFLLTLQLT